MVCLGPNGSNDSDNFLTLCFHFSDVINKRIYAPSGSSE